MRKGSRRVLSTRLWGRGLSGIAVYKRCMQGAPQIALEYFQAELTETGCEGHGPTLDALGA